MSREEYMRKYSKYLPPDIRDLYQIEGLIVAGGYLYIRIIKVMYRLKQASMIAYNQIVYHMDPHI